MSEVKTKYIPIPDWKKHHDWPKEGGLRHLVFNRKQNGFDKCVKKVGKRILIDEAAFFRWVEETSEMEAQKLLDSQE